jgi:ankyrin repeat protein
MVTQGNVEAEFVSAVRDGDRARVEALLARESRLATVRQGGASAILIARYHGRHEIVALLRAQVAALDVFEAAALGDRDRVERLVDQDRTLVNGVAEDGFGPLGLASFFDHEPVVRLLLERGARVDQPSSNALGVMPLHSAVAARSVPITRLLLARGAPVNARQGNPETGFTPLMEAAMNGQVEMVNLLLEHGADRTLRDDKDLTAADHARQRGHAKLVDLLGYRM